MKQLIRKKAVSAALVGLASGVIVNTVNLASAHAASTTDNTTSTSGTTRSKNVLYVDEQGAVVGSGKITETSKSDGNGGTVFTYAVDKTIPAGYSLKSTSALTGYPDKLTVIKSKTTTNTSASEETAMASAPTTPQPTTKTTTSNNGTSQSNTNASNSSESKSDTANPTTPQTITKTTTTPNSTTNTNTNSNDEITKAVTYVDESGKVLGTGKLTKETTSDGQIFYSTDKTIPTGYKLRVDSSLVGMPDKLTLVKGTSTTPNNSDASNTTNSSNAATANTVNNANNTSSKTVTYVDEQGNTIGTGTISTSTTKDGKTIYSVDKSIPAGYALKNNTDLSNYPDKLTLVKDDTSKDTSSASIIDGKSIDDNKDAGNDAESEKEKEEEKAEREGPSSDPEEVDATGGDEDEEATSSNSQKSKKGSNNNAPASSTTTTSANSPASTDSGSSSSSSELPSTGNEKDNAVLTAGTFATGASLLATVLKRRMRSEDK